MQYLVLSLFPGLDLFGRAFEREGFCVVRGPDIIYGQDIREFHVSPGKFDVVIGGPPCKLFSSVGRWIPNPNEDLIPQFERVVHEAQPAALVMENVKEAPRPHVAGYATKDYILDSWEYGANQRRIRRFTFGYRNHGALQPFPFIPEPPLKARLRQPDPFPTVLASEGKFPCKDTAGQKVGRMLTLGEVCELQGFPELTGAYCFQPRGKAKRKIYRKEFEYELIGNGVEEKVGRVVARATRYGLDILNNIPISPVTTTDNRNPR